MPVIPTTSTTDKLDALRTVVAIAAGGGAAATLLLAARRQMHQERVAIKTDFDATERRITELYSKAADQLGSSKAAVRLAGLYSLERLGNDHAQLRQTIVDVLSAYLRMLPADPAVIVKLAAQSLAIHQPSDEADNEGQDESIAENGEHEEEEFELRQELQVRLTAQRLLTGHLMGVPSGGTEEEVPTAVGLRNWGRLSVDLTGAVLFNFTLLGSDLERGVFDHAQFFGLFTDFRNSVFAGDVSFTGATFNTWAQFNNVRFAKTVSFSQAHFGPSSEANFINAEFEGNAHFYRCEMDGIVRFIHAVFHGFVNFREAKLVGSPAGNLFNNIQFKDNVWFTESVFVMDTTFEGSLFEKHVDFLGAYFGRTLSFKDAEIAHDEDMLSSAFININPRPIEMLKPFYDANYLPPGWHIDASNALDSAEDDRGWPIKCGRFVRD